MGRRRNNDLAIFFLLLIVFAFIIFFSQGWGDGLGLPNTLGSNLVSVLPGLFITLISMLGIVHERGNPSVVGLVVLCGIGFAVLIGEMWTAGIIVDGALGTWTMQNIQIATVVMSFVLGGLVYASKN